MSSTTRPVGSSQTHEGTPVMSDGEAHSQKGAGEVRAAIPPAPGHVSARAGDASSVAPRTAGAAAELIRDLTRRAAEHGEDVVRFGANVVAAAQAPLAAADVERGRQFFETSSNIIAAYTDAVHSTAGDALAAVQSFYDIVHGIQIYQQKSLDVAARSYQAMSDRRLAVLSLRSPVAFAEMQRDTYVESVSRMRKSWTDMLDFTTQIAQSGMRPLKERAAADRS